MQAPKATSTSNGRPNNTTKQSSGSFAALQSKDNADEEEVEWDHLKGRLGEGQTPLYHSVVHQRVERQRPHEAFAFSTHIQHGGHGTTIRGMEEAVTRF